MHATGRGLVGTSILNYTITLQRDAPGPIGGLSTHRGAAPSTTPARVTGNFYSPLLTSSLITGASPDLTSPRREKR